MDRRKYTAAEIGRMREAVYGILLFEDFPLDRDARQRITEDRLRTYLAEGVAPEDLEEEGFRAAEATSSSICRRIST